MSADVTFHDVTTNSLILTAATSLHTATILPTATLGQNTLFNLVETGVSSTNFIVGNATTNQSITNTGSAPGISIIGNMSWNIYGQAESRDIANNNYHMSWGVSSANNAAAIFAGNAGVGFIPILLGAAGGSYIGFGSPGNGAWTNFVPVTTPATPVASANLYSKTVSGTTSMYALDSAGVESLLGSAQWTPITYNALPLLQPTGNSQVGVYFSSAGIEGAIYNDGGNYMRHYFNSAEVIAYNASQFDVLQQANFFSNITGYTVGSTISYPIISSQGITGATAASRYVGATASGAPVAGTFAQGDFVIDQTGKIWVCTTAGSPGTFTNIGASPTFSVVNATGATYTVLGTEDFIIGGNLASNVNIQVDQAVLTKPLIIQKLRASLNLTITPTGGTIINGSGNPFTIPATSSSNQGGLVLTSAEDGQNIYITAGDFGTPNDSSGTTTASNGHTAKWVNMFTANSAIAPGGTAQFTLTFDYAFPINIHTSNVTVKEGTSGLPINAKVISQSLSSVVVEIQNMSAVTTIGANSVNLYLSAIGF